MAGSGWRLWCPSALYRLHCRPALQLSFHQLAGHVAKPPLSPISSPASEASSALTLSCQAQPNYSHRPARAGYNVARMRRSGVCRHAYGCFVRSRVPISTGSSLGPGRRRNLPLALVEIESRIQFGLAGQQFLEPRFVLVRPPRLLVKIPRHLLCAGRRPSKVISRQAFVGCASPPRSGRVAAWQKAVADQQPSKPATRPDRTASLQILR